MTKLEDPLALGAVLRQVADDSAAIAADPRHENIRHGERAPIHPMLRLLVWLRDEGRCAFCRDDRRGLMQLDHIVPWSAGGPDVATNLRVACEPCNRNRSNFRELGGPRPRLQVTPMCDLCAERHGRRPRSRWSSRRHDLISSRYDSGLCPLCWIDPELRIGEWDPPQIAWCGQCTAPSAVTGPGRIW